MKCNICKVELDQPRKPSTRNCGGDCIRCMMKAGDIDCIDSIADELDEITEREYDLAIERSLRD